jgi:hypothetical protein
MNVVAMSDLHGLLPDVPECDLLLLAGDLTPCRVTSHFRGWYDDRRPGGMPDVHHPEYQAHWLDTEFRAWLDAIPAGHVVGVAGNHDFVFEQAPGLVPKDLRWTYLQAAAVVVGGFRVWGSPWQLRFWVWAFIADEPDLARRWALIPDDTEIVVLHGPPLGYGDRTRAGEHVGSPSLTTRLRQLPRLRLAVFGHIHPARGEWALGDAILANVSMVNERYELVHEPAAWDLTPRP